MPRVACERSRVLSVVERADAAARPTPVTIGGVRGGPSLSTVLRKDRWWVQPALIVFGLLAFTVYATWAAFRNGHYYAGVGLSASNTRNYLSPFYSPCLTNGCATGPFIHGLGFRWAFSPALLILVFPLGFRMTCYYYRKSYYRSFWLSPPACAVADAGSVGGKRPKYNGESKFPLLIQNVHRYFWYFAVLFAVLLTWDAIQAFRFPNGFGLGIGTLLFIVNAVLIWAYTLGCHSCRHLCGGSTNTLSKSKGRLWFWSNVASKLNEHHQLFAWLSLIWIALTDFYVFLITSNAFHDPRIF